MKEDKYKVYAFIDSQNLNLGVRSCGWELDWRKFRQYLRNKYNVSKVYLFIGYIKKNERLYLMLKNAGYTMIYKPVISCKSKSIYKIKGNIDTELVLTSMIQFSKYNKAVIVSGDGDFRCLIEYLKSQNKLLKILVPTAQYSGLLRKFNKDRFIICIDLLRTSLELKK